MTGTFGGALEAREIKASEGTLKARVRGEVEKQGGVMVVRRIHVVYELKADEKHRETVERVHDLYKEKCPVYLSIHEAIDITTEVRMEAP
ncbi:MAG: OsmC family protein [Gemmatimonadota bacterium]